MEMTDKELVERFLAGDDQAFEQLVQRHIKSVYDFLFQLTRDSAILDDLTQVTFIKVWKNIQRFDVEKNFRTWLFTIAKNTAFDFLKKKKSLPFSFFAEAEQNPQLDKINVDEILPDELLARAETVAQMEQFLDQLAPHYRLILLMHYKDDLSLQEIAEILDRPYNTIKSQHQRALANLKEILTAEDAS